MGFQLKIDLTYHGSLLRQGDRMITNALEGSTNELLSIGKQKAIEHYKSKRISRGSSRIISTFSYNIEDAKNMSVIGVMFTDAPYAIYVDETGWKTKTGHKEGYHFMLAGTKEMKKMARRIIFKHLKNLRG